MVYRRLPTPTVVHRRGPSGGVGGNLRPKNDKPPNGGLDADRPVPQPFEGGDDWDGSSDRSRRLGATRQRERSHVLESHHLTGRVGTARHIHLLFRQADYADSHPHAHDRRRSGTGRCSSTNVRKQGPERCYPGSRRLAKPSSAMRRTIEGSVVGCNVKNAPGLWAVLANRGVGCQWAPQLVCPVTDP